ncbi:UU173 family protein [Metamycoplasma hominis]|uniref:UU173 family protein n=1 Tax=Metamycoplasma hominis TaxID=2098 RepID=UPI00193AAE66|nr:DUF2779 domain-containing protein [Metamycoplasma hominis]
MNKPKYFNYKNFLILNTARPYFAFNNWEEELLNDFSEVYESDNQEDNSYEMLEFANDDIENILDKNFNQYFENNSTKNKDFLKLNTIEKIKKIQQDMQNDSTLFEKINSDGKLELFNKILDNFFQFQMVDSGIALVEEQIINFLTKNSSNKVNIISKKSSTDEKILQTKEFLMQNSLIINPVFEYKKCISKPFYYDSKTKEVGNIVYSSKTSLKDLLRAYYDYSVLSSSGIEINKIFIVKPWYQTRKNSKKNELKIIKTEYCNYKKSKATFDKKKNLSETEINAIFDKNPLLNEDNKKIKNDKIIDYVKNELNLNNAFNFNSRFEIEDNDAKSKISKYTCNFSDFLKIVENFDSNKEIHELDCNITMDDLKDNLNLGIKFYQLLVKKVIPKYIICQKELLKLKVKSLTDNSIETKEILDFYENNLISISPDILNKEKCPEYLLLKEFNKKIVWFDFEGVTLPVPMINHSLAWNQLISQTSIIKTQNGEIYSSNDFVYDPLNYNYKTIMKVINDLYDEKADYYVVYNDTYEASRIKEMQEILEYYKDDGFISRNEFDILKEKSQFILSKIIDIENLFFRPAMDCNIKSSIVNLGQIKNVYSIKKIELFVNENKLNLKHKIFPYHELDVKNGGMALQIATLRALNKIRDNEWTVKEAQLKRYCHNDVLAMIMAFDLVEYLLKSKNIYFKNFETYKDLKAKK